jgi:hypothetical protein
MKNHRAAASLSHATAVSNQIMQMFLLVCVCENKWILSPLSSPQELSKGNVRQCTLDWVEKSFSFLPVWRTSSQRWTFA